MTDLKNLIEKYSTEARLATVNDRVYKDQCVYTYETPFSPDGLYVCLNRFIGVARSMIPIYFDKTKSHLYLRIKMSRQEVTHLQTFFNLKSNSNQKKKIPKEDLASGEPEKKKPSKFGIGIDGGFATDQTDYIIQNEYSLFVYPEEETAKLNETTYQHEALTEQVHKSIASIINAESNALKEEVASLASSWDGEKRFVSKHSANLFQLPDPVQIPSNPNSWKCSQCDISKNLWMNLTDGVILCGRKQLDGTGGNNHAIEHYDKTKYPLAVKLGTSNFIMSYFLIDLIQNLYSFL